MIGHYINLLFAGNSIYRWNNFPRVEKVTETDNLSFVIHIVITMSFILKEKEGIEIDLNYIIKKLVFPAFVKFVLSDIDYSVKNNLEKKDPHINRQLENKILKLLLQFDAPENLKKDIKNIYELNKFDNMDKFETEDNLIKFAKLWAAYYEIYFNNKVYDYYFQELLKDTTKRLEHKKFKLFNKYLPISHSPEWSPTNFLLTIRRLQANYRWNKLQRVNNVSVMSHLFIVFVLAYIIGEIEELSSDEIMEMMMIGLYHDIGEAVTGDIVSTTKKAVKGFDKIITEIEEEMIEDQLLSNFKGYNFQHDIKRYICDPWSGKLGKLVKLADIFSALFEAKQEVTNNQEYKEIYTALKRAVQKFDYKCVNYLLNNGVEYFSDNMDEIIKNHFKFKM